MDRPPPDAARRRDLVAAWAVGAVAALAVVGPGLRSGAWFNVDLVVTDVTPVPRGTWALGPELPRRVPFALPFAWLSSVVPGALPWKLAVTAALASAGAGTWRLAARWDPDTGALARAGAAVLAAIGPFSVTRAGAGHLGLTFALAVLPWALPALLRPADRPARTALWCVALGLAGPFGGTLAVPVVAIGLLLQRAWTPAGLRAGLAALVAQGPWLAPTLVVAALGTDIAGAGAFRTDDHGPGGLLRLLAGHGFWLRVVQVGGRGGWEVPLAGAALLGLALVGRRALAPEVRRPATAVAAVGLAVAAASAVADGAIDGVTELPGLQALREGHRLLALFLAVALPLAALGAARLARRLGGGPGDVIMALPLALAVPLVAPGLLGAAHAFDPVPVPHRWADVRDEVRAHPGPVLALPWASYPRLAIADGRNVVHPLRIYLGGDVLASSDAGFGDGSQERADPREPVATDLAERMAAGEPVGAELAALGIRWVVAIPVLGGPQDPVPGDPLLRPVVRSAEISLYEVDGWGDRDGPQPVGGPLAPVRSLDEGPAVLAAPAAGGWRRGLDPARSAGPLLAAPEGAGPLWYPPALVALGADGAALALGAGAAWRLRRRRGVPVAGPTPAQRG